MLLSDMKVGSKARIIKVNAGEKGYRKRLVSMGLLPGTEFVVSRIAPLGDPVEIMIRDFALCLRKNEADLLELVEVQSI